jgi:hypothetical protein
MNNNNEEIIVKVKKDNNKMKYDKPSHYKFISLSNLMIYYSLSICLIFIAIRKIVLATDDYVNI